MDWPADEGSPTPLPLPQQQLQLQQDGCHYSSDGGATGHAAVTVDAPAQFQSCAAAALCCSLLQMHAGKLLRRVQRLHCMAPPQSCTRYVLSSLVSWNSVIGEPRRSPGYPLLHAAIIHLFIYLFAQSENINTNQNAVTVRQQSLELECQGLLW